MIYYNHTATMDFTVTSNAIINDHNCDDKTECLIHTFHTPESGKWYVESPNNLYNTVTKAITNTNNLLGNFTSVKR